MCPFPRPSTGVPKIASKVEVGEETQRKAIEILDNADRLNISAGKNPMDLAAAALYLACVTNTQRETNPEKFSRGLGSH